MRNSYHGDVEEVKRTRRSAPDGPQEKKPLVGITAIPRLIEGFLTSYPGHTIDDNLSRGVTEAGGVPLVLARVPDELAAAQVKPLDALVLTGGSDVDASFYGRTQDPASTWVDPDRDRWELAVITAALEEGARILAICRGTQLLNVACGGTLHGHLDPELGHELPNVYEQEGRHRISVTPGSALASILGAHTALVASYHHQALDKLGTGLRVTAMGPDGVVEAVENGDGGVLGVQWHPELQLREPAGQTLFDWLVAPNLERGLTDDIL